ncbi:MAG: hypothetical protein AB7E23_03025 [Bacilli bacterium]
MNRYQKAVIGLRIRMGMTLLSLAVALTSLAYVTYSWFLFNRQADVALSVSVESLVSYELKYFVANGEGGYPASDYDFDDIDVSVTDYSSEFLPIDPDFHQYTKMLDQPAYRLTYALELTLPSAVSQKDYEIMVSGFTSEASDLFYDYATGLPIEIKQAIEIYATVVDGDQSNSMITSAVNSFVTSVTPVGGDLFDGEDEYTHLGDVSYVVNESPSKKIFLFTLEFSNDPSTLYMFREYGEDKMYYDKSPLGNSNVYRALTFSLDSLLIRKK